MKWNTKLITVFYQRSRFYNEFTLKTYTWMRANQCILLRKILVYDVILGKILVYDVILDILQKKIANVA